MNTDIIDALPRLLKRLSDGEGLHIPTLSKELGIPKSTLQEQIKRYLLLIVIAEITHDFSTRNWTAKRNFLSETLLSESELVTRAGVSGDSNSIKRSRWCLRDPKSYDLWWDK